MSPTSTVSLDGSFPVGRTGLVPEVRMRTEGGVRTEDEVVGEDETVPDLPWVTVVWNDPVNLMTYVTWVFQKLFGYSRDKAERLMLDVHQKGRAIVSTGARERMEHDASRLQAYGLWATVGRG